VLLGFEGKSPFTTIVLKKGEKGAPLKKNPFTHQCTEKSFFRDEKSRRVTTATFTGLKGNTKRKTKRMTAARRAFRKSVRRAKGDVFSR